MINEAIRNAIKNIRSLRLEWDRNAYADRAYYLEQEIEKEIEALKALLFLKFYTRS